MNPNPANNIKTVTSFINKDGAINNNHANHMFVTIPATSGQTEPPTRTHQNHQHQNTHNDIPECSSANTQRNYPSFSYYPEQVVEEGVKACQRSILGKIITEKPIHVSSIQMGLDSIWGSPSGLMIQEIEGKILQFVMDNSRTYFNGESLDFQKLLAGGEALGQGNRSKNVGFRPRSDVDSIMGVTHSL
jgi:hypothetical protein